MTSAASDGRHHLSGGGGDRSDLNKDDDDVEYKEIEVKEELEEDDEEDVEEEVEEIEVEEGESLDSPIENAAEERTIFKYYHGNAFDVDVTEDIYEEFISKIRRRMGLDFSKEDVPCEDIPSDKCFLITLSNPLPYGADDADAIFDKYTQEIVNSSPEIRYSEICLYIRIISPCNVYLVGYDIDEPLPYQGLEFRTVQEPQLIPQSTFLDFDGCYRSLEMASKQKIADIKIGRNALKRAVDLLATSTKVEDRAWSLIVMSQMICEPLKSTHIFGLLVRYYTDGLFPDEQMLREEQCREFLGYGMPNPVKKLRAGPSEDYHNMIQPLCQGQPAVEVFGVYINGINGEDLFDFNLYGTIEVIGLTSSVIYNRTADRLESMKQKETALLTGPGPISITAYYDFHFDVKLRGNDPIKGPDEFTGKFLWISLHVDYVYDKPLSVQCNGKYGSATLRYIVLSDALAATVEVELVKGDGGGEEPANIYGKLIARNDSSFSDCESLLFRIRKDEDEYIEVSPGQPFLLSRSLVVPMNSHLIIEADLCDGEIAKGTAKFLPSLSDCCVIFLGPFIMHAFYLKFVPPVKR